MADLKFFSLLPSSPLLPYSLCLSSADVLIANVVLLNLLIAMMGDTYTNVKDKADSQWFLERARIILQIEASMSKEERMKEENKYYGIDSKTGRPFLQSEVEDMLKFRADNKNGDVENAAKEVRAATAAFVNAHAPPAPRSASNPRGGSAAAAGAAAAAEEAASAVAQPRRRRASGAAATSIATAAATAAAEPEAPAVRASRRR